MTSTIKTISIEVLAEKLGGNLWTKGEIKRIYLDRGHNTKKMETKTYVYQREDGTYAVKCNIDCPSQNGGWIISQQEQVITSVGNDIAEIIEEFGTEILNPKIAIEAKLAEEEQVQGYYLQWKEVRVAINRFGKLAERKRMFVTTFKGPKSKAHPRLIELTDAEMVAALDAEKKERAYEYGNEPNFKIANDAN